MFIRFGFEIDLKSAAPVPMLPALSTHTEMAGRLIGKDRVRIAPDVAARPYVDRSGNRITWIEAPAGATRLWTGGTGSGRSPRLCISTSRSGTAMADPTRWRQRCFLTGPVFAAISHIWRLPFAAP